MALDRVGATKFLSNVLLHRHGVSGIGVGARRLEIIRFMVPVRRYERNIRRERPPRQIPTVLQLGNLSRKVATASVHHIASMHDESR